MAESGYKFYLSFENSFCTGYVTEKFYKALELDIIPVVMGGADYKARAPPKELDRNIYGGGPDNATNTCCCLLRHQMFLYRPCSPT